METGALSPEQLLDRLLTASRDDQLRICRLAVEASDAATECFMAGHCIEIDNLRHHISELSAALLAAVNGEAVDPVLVAAARNAVAESVSVGNGRGGE